MKTASTHRTAWIYALVDGCGEIRYIGRSIRPTGRMNQHLRMRTSSPLSKWIQQTTSTGGLVEMIIIQSMPEQYAGEAERFWVQHFRGAGCRLLNVTAGGGGITYGKPINEEYIASRVKHIGSCWVWTGAINHAGHAVSGAARSDGASQIAHRLSWQMWRGEIPAGVEVGHVCDTSRCVNPNHLVLGGRSDTIKRSYSIGRRRPKPQTGELNASSKLTWEQVREIRRTYKPRHSGRTKSPSSMESIACRYGVHAETIRKIIKNVHWKDEEYTSDEAFRDNNTTVSASDVVAIRSMRGTATHREIAKKFGISKSHVTNILAGRARRCV